jgi:flavorubredoxin
VDDKVALVDTVWQPFTAELFDHISEVIAPGKIDFIIASHAEVDHSGALPELLKHCPKATVIVSPRGLESFQGHYHQPWNFKVVKTGDEFSLGQRKLKFIEAPMLHWPDTLFTYLEGDGILFSNDAFGEHYATSSLFNDDADQEVLAWEGVKYYANILNPFGSMVERKIEEILSFNLPLNMIAPSHGVIWRKDPMQIVEKYRRWARQEPQRSVVIVYETMWQGTRHMAEAIGEGLSVAGLPFTIFNSATADRNDIMTEMFLSRAIILGSPTFNNGILPTLAPVLEDMKGLKFKNKLGAAFGTYGWSGEGADILENHLKLCGYTVAAPAVKAKWQPDAAALEACRRLGTAVGEACKAAR